MRVLFLLRHSLTAANAAQLYCGWGDPPLSPEGRTLAHDIAKARALPVFDCAVTSGLRRADETLLLLTGRAPDAVLSDLREMHFGAFEMRSYDQLRGNADYLRWIEDESGTVACPGGESRQAFDARVSRGGDALLSMTWTRAIAVTHGGVIVALMRRWVPDEPRGFYDWQPQPCRGYRVAFNGISPVAFEEV